MKVINMEEIRQSILDKVGLDIDLSIVKHVLYDETLGIYVFNGDDFYFLCNNEGEKPVYLRCEAGKIKSIEKEDISYYDLMEEDSMVFSFDGNIRCVLAMTCDVRNLYMAAIDKYIGEESVLSLLSKQNVVRQSNDYPYIYYQSFNFPDVIILNVHDKKYKLYYLVEFNHHDLLTYIYGLWRISDDVIDFYKKVKEAYNKNFPTFRRYVKSKLLSGPYFDVKNNLLLGKIYTIEDLQEMFKDFGGLAVDRNLIKFYNGELEEVNDYQQALRLIRNND